MSRQKKFVAIFATLTALTLISFALHVVRIGEPQVLVGDEPHFATYASDYASGTGFYDIHPPFGKLILAASARLSGVNTPYFFVKLLPWHHGAMFETTSAAEMPHGFPYQNLRLTVATFGTILPLSVFLLLWALGAGTGTALLGAFFITFENVLLLHSRLIMLDAFFMPIGIVGTALFFLQDRFEEKSHGRRLLFLASAVLLGMAGAVKLSGFMFALGILLALMISPTLRARYAPPKMAWMALSLFLLPIIVGFALHQIVLGTHAQLSFWKYIFPNSQIDILARAAFPSSLFLQNTIMLAAIRMLEGIFSIGAYLGGFKPEGFNAAVGAEGGPLAWLFMWKPGLYAMGPSAALAAIGNPVVWGSATFALFKSAVLFARQVAPNSGRTALCCIFLANFLLYVPPWLTGRPMSLFHYMPAYTIAIALCAYSLKPLVARAQEGSLKHRAVLFGIGTATVAAFVLIAPFTYYIPLL